MSLKLQRGDRIGIWGPNSYEWALTQWAAARAGLVLVRLERLYNKNSIKSKIFSFLFRQNVINR